MELTHENTAIVLDSTADFPEAPERFPNMRVVPLYVRFGDESFRDYVELGPDEFYERLRTRRRRCRRPRSRRRRTSWRPTRSSPATSGSSRSTSRRKLSGTFASARSRPQAARRRPGPRCRLRDRLGAIAMLALAIQRRLERGTTDEEIEALVERFRRERGLLFTVDTLEYLAKGGRIGRAQALAGSCSTSSRS